MWIQKLSIQLNLARSQKLKQTKPVPL